MKGKLKHCDNPAPAGGDLCPCNQSPNETSCSGLVALIEEPCNLGPCEGNRIISWTVNFMSILYRSILLDDHYLNRKSE